MGNFGTRDSTTWYSPIINNLVWSFCFYPFQALEQHGSGIWRFQIQGHLVQESGMIRWWRVGACDQDIRVRFPALVVISDLVVVGHST